ncbi:hypothetical protein [Ferrovibrio terrae]|uniref:hypothetical protein n=1 Tax=Ferrovibrio terrae TaxID=2594003 RepID=UPI0031380A8E
MENFRKKISSLLLVLLVTLLAGACSTKSSSDAPKDIRFNADSPGAILVIGMKSATPIESWLGSQYRAFTMTWTRSKASVVQYPGPTGFVVDNAGRDMLIFKSSLQEEMTWHVLRVPAGTYMLRQIHTSMANHHQTTQLSGTINAPFFALKPGEVRYIGDLHVNVADFPAKIIKLTRNDEPAKAALAKLPGITVKPFFRQPAYFAEAGQPARLMPVSE